MPEGFTVFINATRGSDDLQWETVNGVPLQNVASAGSVALQCETLEDVQRWSRH